jgi:hypothetical protein
MQWAVRANCPAFSAYCVPPTAYFLPYLYNHTLSMASNCSVSTGLLM